MLRFIRRLSNWFLKLNFQKSKYNKYTKTNYWIWVDIVELLYTVKNLYCFLSNDNVDFYWLRDERRSINCRISSPSDTVSHKLMLNIKMSEKRSYPYRVFHRNRSYWPLTVSRGIRAIVHVLDLIKLRRDAFVHREDGGKPFCRSFRDTLSCAG